MTTQELERLKSAAAEVGMRLSLHKARMAPLARFEVAPAP